ncbi:MAG TPA: hypothetical protein ENN44_07415 [Methanoculleus sp.]|nr:hypothetical protein [Methanoculleus sp.]
MVWILSTEDNYVNVDNIISLTFDNKCNSFVAVVGHRDVRLQHKIYHLKPLGSLLQGTQPPTENEILEEIISAIETARREGSPDILDFNKILDY